MPDNWWHEPDCDHAWLLLAVLIPVCTLIETVVVAIRIPELQEGIMADRLSRLYSILDARAWIQAGQARRGPEGRWFLQTKDRFKVAVLERAWRQLQEEAQE